MEVFKESMKKSAYMMQPQNYSVNDGDGIRTVLFLAGCPLRCRWCANPESFIKIEKNNSVHEKNEFVKAYSVSEISEGIDKQSIFYRFSGGGITFSGGEPTVQVEFLDELSLELYNAGYDLAIETCGYFEFDKVKPILDRIQLIFVDIKIMNEDAHQHYTGKSNKTILDNIKKMGVYGYSVVVRIPIIEGVNATVENVKRTALFVKKHLKNPRIELLPYHNIGEYKYDKLQKSRPPMTFRRPNKDQMMHFAKIIEDEGVCVVNYL